MESSVYQSHTSIDSEIQTKLPTSKFYERTGITRQKLLANNIWEIETLVHRNQNTVFASAIFRTVQATTSTKYGINRVHIQFLS